MRRMLNTLFITSPMSYLAREGENIVIRQEEKDDFRFPIHNIESIVYFGYPGISPGLIGLCMERGISLTFLTEHNRFLGRVEGASHGNVLLRRKQYRLSDTPSESLELSKYTVAAKILNSRSILQRGLRDYPEINLGGFEKTIVQLLQASKNLEICKDLEDVRGIEGRASKEYFEYLDHLILEQKEHFFFRTRSRRPPKDRFNAMLSFVYTLLTHECRSALESVGLDAAVGFLHRDRPGRASLALDLVEEFRAYLGDRFVLSMINRRQIKENDFDIGLDGSVTFKADARKAFLTNWQTRKQDEIIHPYLNEKIPIGLLPYSQALLLARFIRGDLDAYPAFLLK